MGMEWGWNGDGMGMEWGWNGDKGLSIGIQSWDIVDIHIHIYIYIYTDDDNYDIL